MKMAFHKSGGFTKPRSFYPVVMLTDEGGKKPPIKRKVNKLPATSWHNLMDVETAEFQRLLETSPSTWVSF